MTTRLLEVFRLRDSAEATLVLVMALLLFFNSLTLVMSDVIAISGFLESAGVNELLIVYIVDMLIIMLTAGLQSLVVDRFERVNFLAWMSLAVIGMYILLRIMFMVGVPDPLNYAILYLMSDLQWLFFPLVFWVLASDIFDVAQTRRLFPLISTGSLIGQILGLVLVGAAPAFLNRIGVSSVDLLYVNVAIFAIVFLLIRFYLGKVKVRKTTVPQQTVRETLAEGWGFVREVPLFRYLMFSAVALAAAFITLEFRFYVTADDAFAGADFQTFYSVFRIIATGGAFLIQTTITSRLLERFGLKNIFFILPVVMMLGIAAMIGLPGVIATAISFAIVRLVWQTIEETARKSMLSLVPEERRGRVSMFMDSYLLGIGTILGCLVTGAVILLGERAGVTDVSLIYLGLAAMGAVFAIWATTRMRATYDTSLLNWRLKRRQRTSRIVDKLNLL